MQIVIYGNGSMARVLYSYARRSMDVRGFTVDDVCIQPGDDTLCGLPLIPFSRVLEAFNPSEYTMIIAIGFIEMNELRERKYNEAKAMGYSFTNYIHPSFILHDDVRIGENCIIYENVAVHPGSSIGNSVFITANASIGHDCRIEHSNWINSGVSIAGGVHVRPGCFFGVNACVAHGVTIGARNFIGANTLIGKNTGDDEVYLSETGQLFRMKSKAFLKFSRMLD